MYEEMRYEEAAKAFEKCVKYKDSSTMMMEASYQLAKEKINAGDYEAAKDILIVINGYNNADELVTECDYLQAKKYYDNERYAEADIIFSNIKKYKDVKEFIAKIIVENLEGSETIDETVALSDDSEIDLLAKYYLADKLFEQMDYKNAKVLYEACEDVKDSKDKIEKCILGLVDSYIDKEQYRRAYDMLLSLDDSKDEVKERKQNCVSKYIKKQGSDLYIVYSVPHSDYKNRYSLCAQPRDEILVTNIPKDTYFLVHLKNGNVIKKEGKTSKTDIMTAFEDDIVGNKDDIEKIELYSKKNNTLLGYKPK